MSDVLKDFHIQISKCKIFNFEIFVIQMNVVVLVFHIHISKCKIFNFEIFVIQMNVVVLVFHIHISKCKIFNFEIFFIQMNVVLRDFRIFEPQLEFRGFVCNSKFTALTQYNEAIYFPHLTEKYVYQLYLELFEFEILYLESSNLKSCIWNIRI